MKKQSEKTQDHIGKRRVDVETAGRWIPSEKPDSKSPQQWTRRGCYGPLSSSSKPTASCRFPGGALPHPLATVASMPFPIPTALRAWVLVMGNHPWALDPCSTKVAVADSLGCIRVMGGTPSPRGGSVQGRCVAVVDSLGCVRIVGGAPSLRWARA